MNVTVQRLILTLLLKSEASEECRSLLRSLHSRGGKLPKSEGYSFFFFFTVYMIKGRCVAMELFSYLLGDFNFTLGTS